VYPLIEVSPSFQIPTYLLFLSFLYCFLIYWTVQRAKARAVSQKDALDLAFAIMIGGFVGARLFHIVYESPEYYSVDWKRIFYVWEGGFVFFGGAFGALIASLAVLRIKKISFALWADFYAPIFALGYGLGRISCFLAGCCYGRPLDTFWAVHGRHPTQLYAVVFELIVFAILIRLEKKPRAFVGEVFTLWVGLHALGRLFMESFRDDFRGPTLMGLSISSWITLLLMAGSVAFYLFKISRKSRSL
jgi:phosphatidylglycerol:prolipoprotein diacylglycerol transferase